VRQPGSKLRYKQDGSIEGVLILEGDRTFRSLAPGIDSSHPDDSRALCYDVEIEDLKSDKIRAIASYIGVASDPTPWFKAGQGSLDKESLLTHPKFVSEMAGTPDAPLNSAKFDPETGEFLGFPADAGNNLGGMDSWFVPSVVWTFTRWTYREPTFTEMGKIDNTPVPVKRPPNLVNFLAGPKNYSQIGRLYQERLEYWGSGERGWNEIAYRR